MSSAIRKRVGSDDDEIRRQQTEFARVMAEQDDEVAPVFEGDLFRATKAMPKGRQQPQQPQQAYAANAAKSAEMMLLFVDPANIGDELRAALRVVVTGARAASEKMKTQRRTEYDEIFS